MSTVTESLFARDLMTREVICVPAAMPVASLARLLAERGISAVPVTGGDGRLLGIVTELDLIRRLSGAEERPGWLHRLFGSRDRDAERYAQLHGMLAEDVMTRDLITVTENTPVEQIARIMEERGIRRVPVLRGERLVGIVSRADLLQALLVPPASLGEGGSEDERIREVIWREIRQQPWADTIYTFVAVKNGVVEFQGFARSQAVRRGLQSIAHRVPGVRQVVDNMVEGVPQNVLY
ncbi:CBS domain-containing protein [Roseomonas sp. SSH11]|uniref:CBS domain-containing protein n=1 Tax=Pararoseomonas baculiformis TaxID=2820812 RepID=A0ABS4AJ27_9PROT|nr:CBS domain-containing protein [Pararoseomonas baculiformis]MBP0447028.1 CBS domain-containing protein [Pararoseomonas baculiformis]